MVTFGSLPDIARASRKASSLVASWLSSESANGLATEESLIASVNMSRDVPLGLGGLVLRNR